MKAAVLSKLKSPLEVKEIDIDKKLASDEVLLKVEMAGICYRDILTIDGHFPRVKLPIILGHEMVGRVISLGESVKAFKEGDLVTSLTYVPCGECKSCKAGNENLCRRKMVFGEELNGSFAEMVKVPERSLVKVPEGVSLEGATIAACVTAMLIRAFEVVAGVKGGEIVMITGAGGGVGIHAVQVAKALGCNVIAVTSSKEKVDAIYKAGADHVLINDEKLVDEIKRLTNGEGVDVALEAVGQPTFEKSLRSLAWGGKVVVVGNITVSSVEVPLGFIILRANSISGTISSTKRDLEKALRMTADGKVVPITTVYPLDMVNEAMDKMRRKESLGRILLKP